MVQKRLHALYLKATSTLSHQQIAQLVGIHRSTLTSYIHLYHQKGLAGVYEVGYGTNRSELDLLISALETNCTGIGKEDSCRKVLVAVITTSSNFSILTESFCWVFCA